MSPDDAVAAFRRLGAEVIPKRGKGNHTWMELLDEQRHQIAIFNVPMNRNPIPTGLFLLSLLRRNGIRDLAHLNQLLASPDPRGAYRAVLDARRQEHQP